MNVRSEHDLEFANLARKIIFLGGSATDLKNLFPDYFGFDEASSMARSIRVHKDLKPKYVRVKSRRIVSYVSLFKTKENILLVSDFTKLILPFIEEASKKDNFIFIFLECYEAWLDSFEEKERDPLMSFQKAFSIFRYTVTKKINFSEFKKCHSCQSHYLPIVSGRTGKTIQCPYC